MNTSTIGFAGAVALALGLCAHAAAQDFQAEYDAQWGLAMIGVDAAWAAGYTGKGVLVGVTDSGLEVGAFVHPELANNVTPGLYYDGYEVGMDDWDGHGTHVAGTIAAARDGYGMVGVAYDATIVPLRMLEGPDGTGLEDTMLSTIIDYSLSHGIRLFNASWGTPGQYNDAWISPAALATTSEMAALRRLVSNDAVIVFATGNNGADAPSVQAALPYYFPELRPAWLAVTAVGPTGTRASYAQACSVAMYWCIAAPGGDIVTAPEQGIYATYPGGTYEYLDGASMATPHVTGAMAIASQMYPNARMQDLSGLVLNTATDIGDRGVDPIYGWGLLNVANLVKTNSPDAGNIFAQSAWAQSATVDRLLDQATATRRDTTAETPLWFTPFGGFGFLNGSTDDLSGGFGTAGIVGGVDIFAIQDWRIGALGGLSAQHFSSKNDNSAADTAVHLGAYASFDNSQVFTDLTLGGSVFWGNTMRNNAPGLAGTVLEGNLGNAGQHVDSALWGDIKLGGHLDVSGITLSPYGFARTTRHNLAGVVESGDNALLLSVAATTLTRTELGVGFELQTAGMAFEHFTLTPSFDLAYGREIGDAFTRDFDLLGNAMQASTDTLGPNIIHFGAALTAATQNDNFHADLVTRAPIEPARSLTPFRQVYTPGSDGTGQRCLSAAAIFS